ERRTGQSGIFAAIAGSIITIAETGDLFDDFQGLPVINRQGVVVFRADLKAGGQGIYAGGGGALTTIVDNTRLFNGLGLFPCQNNRGTVVFSAALQAGGAGIITASDGEISAVADTNGAFETFRGALIDDAGTIVFIATPRGGQL